MTKGCIVLKIAHKQRKIRNDSKGADDMIYMKT